jgi:hypothetical protein
MIIGQDGASSTSSSSTIRGGSPMLRVVIMSAAALVAAVAGANAETPLERGSYLVNAVMACDGCHTPRTPAGFVMEKRFSGGSQT